jgi:hypothetical protein
MCAKGGGRTVALESSSAKEGFAMNVRKSSLPALALCAGSLALGVAAVPASADTFTLSLSAPPTASVGQAFVMQASGNNPPDQGVLYLDIDAIPASVTTTCPAGYLDASQMAPSVGGSHVAFDQPENEDASGNFSNSVGYTPDRAGAVLFCAYTHDYATDTLATSSAIVNVGSAGTTTTSPKPADHARPRVRRSGSRLVCSRGTWANGPTRFGYRWLVDGHTVKGAHKSKLTIGHRERGHRVRCGVTATNAAGSASALSAPFKVK